MPLDKGGVRCSKADLLCGEGRQQVLVGWQLIQPFVISSQVEERDLVTR